MKAALLALIAVMVWGCSEPPQAPTNEPNIVTPALTPSKNDLPAPDFLKGSKLALKKALGPGEVKVGDNSEDAFAVFVEPKGSYEKSDLPPSITAKNYAARGWQNKDEGFGLILFGGRVVAAVYQLEHQAADRVNEVFNAYQDAFGPPVTFNDGKYHAVLPGNYVRYWFWQSGNQMDPGDQILMICATESQPKEFNITVAVGWIPVMEALGMTPDLAALGQGPADRLLKKQNAATKPKTANSSNR